MTKTPIKFKFSNDRVSFPCTSAGGPFYLMVGNWLVKSWRWGGYVIKLSGVVTM